MPSTLRLCRWPHRTDRAGCSKTCTRAGPHRRRASARATLLLAVNGQRVEPPSLPTFALGQDHAVTVENGNGQSRTLQVVLPKAETNGKAPSKLLDGRAGKRHRPGDYAGNRSSPLAFFPGVNGQKFARALDAALAQLPDCNRLIVDLRGNLGGFVGSLRLMSYLTVRPTSGGLQPHAAR